MAHAGNGFSALYKMPQLASLSLVNCSVGDTEIAELVNSPSLRHLSLANTQVSDSGIQKLPH